MKNVVNGLREILELEFKSKIGYEFHEFVCVHFERDPEQTLHYIQHHNNPLNKQTLSVLD